MKRQSTIHNLSIICIFTLIISACQNNKPEPYKADINDLLGIWVSLDSNIVQDINGVFRHKQDTLNISPDLIAVNTGKSYDYSFLQSKRSYYSFQYFRQDSLVLAYEGPLEIGFLNNRWPNKVLFSTNKDTIHISKWRETYPGHFTNDFYKIK